MKVNELTGAALDWAVAKIEKHRIDVHKSKHYTELRSLDLTQVHDDNWVLWNPSDDWSQGGPIIEREGITVKCQGLHWLKTPKSNPESAWVATLDLQNGGEHGGWLEPSNYTGATPLIAAMRCYVASKLGDEVDVPEELRA